MTVLPQSQVIADLKSCS
uniref:Uncharacterized protein n=1 Tax=Anguilla anguilla TaxID=7936 RepID=A0A0E9VX92_ANGAN